MISFFLPMIPPTVTQQQHDIKVVRGKPVVYDPPRLKDARQKFTALLLAQKGRISASDYCLPLEGPIRLVTKWLFPIPEGSGHLDGEWKITKPDTDNSLKLFKDCITRTGWWVDDAQVCSEITEKFWGARPGIYVRIESIGDYDDD